MRDQALLILSVIGFLIALYAYYVEKRTEKDKTYKPLCDITSVISCTKAFKSKYGKHFDVPNPVWGMLFYALIFVLTLLHQYSWIMLFATASVLGSIYLAYMLYTKVKSLCLVCTSIYLVNILLMLASVY